MNSGDGERVAPRAGDGAVLAALAAALGEAGVLQGADVARYCADWRGLYRGEALAVLRPADAASLGRAVAIAADAGLALVPQGGNTGLCGGAVPDAGGRSLVVSLERMRRVRAVDPADMTMTVDAGVTLAAAQAAAAEAGCRLPLSIGSEGTAQIGGVLSTNAGGNNTLRYGNARELVLGLEVVLADGRVWDGLRRLRKDNTGYALRQLFIGAEGTLGIVTGAVLKLEPASRQREVAFCSLPSPEAALDLLRAFRAADPGAVQAFEYMGAGSLDLVLAHIEGAALPVAEPAPAYALVELATPRAGDGLRSLLEEVLSAAIEDGTVRDAVVAESEAQRAALWRLREEHTEAQKRAGASVKNDVSVPVSATPALIARAAEACRALIPGVRVVPFGHLGDGNIHFNLAQPEDMTAEAFLARSHEIMDTVNTVVRALGGSFSAEHGVGQLKTGMMEAWRGGAELELMQRVKAAFDPDGRLNPGKVLPAGPPGSP